MGRDIFITGASGFLGRNLLRAFAENGDDRFFLLARSAQAERLISKHLNGVDSSRLSIVRGDITEPGCGVLDSCRHALSQSVREVWHVAASTSFEEAKREEIAAVNIGGTGNVLALCREFRRLERFYHVGTAYICGVEQRSIPEGPFPRPRQFKNPYEETKYDGEALVRTSGQPFVIIRPSIMMGDSRTGDAGGDGRMLYGYLLALYRSALHRLGGSAQFARHYDLARSESDFLDVRARLPGRAEVTKNLVTLDDVVAVCRAVRNAGNHCGATYNVVNSVVLTGQRMTDAIQAELKLSGFKYDEALTPATLDRGNVVECAAWRYTKAYWPYMRHSEPVWETANVDRLGVPRVVMSEDLFASLMRRYVAEALIGKHVAPEVPTV